ncbi:hypothetical protein AT728_35645 [Streptomyces silvensis]|uniref:Uncharacterized protein n=1 Tax=Streptomyces silvensis TaxID=1765722 RepID=A0A0W7WW48_9ACTN|nr:hypothetical protein AT728_35645 [Streptomyces silvensis]
MAYFDAAEHVGARGVSARDLAELHDDRLPASVYFTDTLRLRRPGFTRRLRTPDASTPGSLPPGLTRC